MKRLRTGAMALAAIFGAGVFLFIKDGNAVKAAEEGPEAFRPVITWDDYQNTSKPGPTVLHFSLGEETEIDIELPYYPSMVRQTEFLDINGDGLEEALIYRYFANSATEYTLIDIFEIQDNRVRNLSPETELEELAGNVWDMSLTETAAEETESGESGFVFRLDSYEKKCTVAFRDETVLVEYGAGGWKITGHVSWKAEQAAWLVKENIKSYEVQSEPVISVEK